MRSLYWHRNSNFRGTSLSLKTFFNVSHHTVVKKRLKNYEFIVPLRYRGGKREWPGQSLRGASNSGERFGEERLKDVYIKPWRSFIRKSGKFGEQGRIQTKSVHAFSGCRSIGLGVSLSVVTKGGRWPKEVDSDTGNDRGVFIKFF